MVIVTKEPESEPMLGAACSEEMVCLTNEVNSCREQAYRDLTSIMKAAPFQINSLETGLNLLTTAIDVQDITLVKRCIEYIENQLNRENVLKIYAFLQKCQMPTLDPNSLEPSAPPLIEDETLKGTDWVRSLVDDLRNSCLLLIDHHANYILKQKEMVKLSYKDIYDIVNRDTLQVSNETLVFNVIYEWGTEECKRMTLNKQHLPEVLRQLRYCPRYGLMKKKEFKSKVYTDILDEKDWRHIKFYLEEKSKNRPVNKLPYKMSEMRVTLNEELAEKSQAKNPYENSKCDKCIINVLACWTAVFD